MGIGTTANQEALERRVAELEAEIAGLSARAAATVVRRDHTIETLIRIGDAMAAELRWDGQPPPLLDEAGFAALNTRIDELLAAWTKARRP